MRIFMSVVQHIDRVQITLNGENSERSRLSFSCSGSNHTYNISAPHTFIAQQNVHNVYVNWTSPSLSLYHKVIKSFKRIAKRLNWTKWMTCTIYNLSIETMARPKRLPGISLNWQPRKKMVCNENLSSCFSDDVFMYSAHSRLVSLQNWTNDDRFNRWSRQNELHESQMQQCNDKWANGKWARKIGTSGCPRDWFIDGYSTLHEWCQFWAQIGPIWHYMCKSHHYYYYFPQFQMLFHFSSFHSCNSYFLTRSS